jgi:glycosyltransferase involved in cell wall biosynthesis
MTSKPKKTSGKVVHEPILASFVVCAYNQEKYIREAVEGAFSQTYSPLEIILSDDCSTDSTFEIMQEMARNYKGPHKIILNRNEKNLGIAGHVNRTFELMNGEIWIAAAGDDISLPQRVYALMTAFANNPSWMAVVSSVELFGIKSGVVYSIYQNRKQSILSCCWDPPPPRGCSAAYRRQVWSRFPPLSSDCLAEDMPLSFRAGLLGISASIPDVLVKYRWVRPDVREPGPAGVSIVKQSGYRQIRRDLDFYASQNNVSFLYLCRLLLDFHEALSRPGSEAKVGISRALIKSLLMLGKLNRPLHYHNWRKRRIFIKNLNQNI